MEHIKNTSINKCYMVFADDNECNSLVYIGYYLEMSFDENYNIDLKYKYNIVLESLLFGFRSVGIHSIDEKVFLECGTEYFKSNTSIAHEDVMQVLKGISLYGNESKQSMIDLLTEDKSIDDKIIKPKNINDLCKLYNMKEVKSVNDVRNIVNRIYGKRIDDCVEETSNILGVFTTTVVSLGMAAVNPILGLLAAFTQYYISKKADISNCDKYIEYLRAEKKKVKRKIDKGGNTEELEKYLDGINNAIEKISAYKYEIQNDKENDDDLEKDMDNDDLDDFDFSLESGVISLSYLQCLSEAIDQENIDQIKLLTETYVENPKMLNEESNIMNTLKLVKANLSNKMKTMSAKEKATCKQIDDRFELFARNLHRALSMEKREQVIRGQVVPSLTRLIKLAVTGGIAALINPAMAAVGMITAYALSKKATLKEKQYILDELEVQLKIIDRKINAAEIKGDDKALEELYRLQSRYNNEIKRIKYGIKVYHEGGCVL